LSDEAALQARFGWMARSLSNVSGLIFQAPRCWTRTD
jgi:hypothetical protein